MPDLSRLFDRNRAWADRMAREKPGFFSELVAQQTPEYLWIGCSDSRVPANEIVDLLPGELFVHRNVANVVVHTDLNCLSVLEYAVDALKVRHVIVCGHYGCGGVRAAHEDAKIGLIDNWLRHVQDVRSKHRALVDAAGGGEAAVDRLCELNVIEQALHDGHEAVGLVRRKHPGSDGVDDRLQFRIGFVVFARLIAALAQLAAQCRPGERHSTGEPEQEPRRQLPKHGALRCHRLVAR